MKEAYIRFLAPVIPKTIQAMFHIIDKKLNEKVERLHLMLSSPGGSVFHGLSLHNFLRGAPIEVYTYNFGMVDSIGVVIFCAGVRRISVPHARFLIHGVQANFIGNQSLNEKDLEERLKGLQIDYKNIARVIADTTDKSCDRIIADMNNRTTLNPQEAKDYGLVHDIATALFPVGADLSVVGEDTGHQQGIQFAVPTGPGQPMQVKHLTTPQVQGVSKAEGTDNGTHFLS